MRVAIRLEFPDERAADVIRWLQAAPKGVEVYLVTDEQSVTIAPDASQAVPPTAVEIR